MEEDSLDGITPLSSNISILRQHEETYDNEELLALSSENEDFRLKCSKTVLLDGKFFNVNFEKSSRGSITANCTYCLKEIKGSLTTTSNFLTHLQRVSIKTKTIFKEGLVVYFN